ncbi:MAG TPA: hypothetical protein VH573_16185 [Mycobacteriales bacterium]|jgi:hypothetical protein
MSARAVEFGRAFVRQARPNPLVVAWRWRYELCAATTLVLLTVRVGALWTVAAALATVAAFAVVPALRWRVWCVLTQHRVRTGLTQAWVFSRSGRIPMVLWTRPVHEGEQLLLLLRPGLTAADLAAAAPVLAAACWAREVVVVPQPTRAALVRLVVVRYDVAAYPASAA